MDTRVSNNRMSARQASVAARQRQTRMGRLTRHTIFTMKRPITFQVRRSLVDYVDNELADMDTSVFYQRIFVLAKNCSLTPEPSEAETTTAVPETGDQGELGEVENQSPGLEFGEDTLIVVSESQSKITSPSILNRSSAEAPEEEKDTT